MVRSAERESAYRDCDDLRVRVSPEFASSVTFPTVAGHVDEHGKTQQLKRIPIERLIDEAASGAFLPGFLAVAVPTFQAE